MSRRSIILVACLAALVGLALVPWTLPSGRLDRQVRREIAQSFGLNAKLEGRATFAMLPLPRVKFGEVTLSAADGTILLRGAQLRGELRLASLLVGRVELSELSLANGRISVGVGPDGRSAWQDTLAPVSRRLGHPSDSPSPMRRLILTGTTVVMRDARSDRSGELDDLNLVLRFPTESTSLDLTASALWRGEAVDFTLADLQTTAIAAGKPSRLDARFRSRLINASVSGDFTWADQPRLVGTASADLPSLRDAIAWAGFNAPGTDRPLSATGEIALSPEEIGVPRLRSTFGAERLDGAVSLRLDGERPAVRATLAGDNLDLSALSRGDTAATDGLRALALRDITGLDLDLRLSATSADLGGITVSDVATSVLTSADKIDVNLGRATVNGGLVRGRITIGTEGDLYDVRGQTSFSRIDIAQSLAALGQSPLMSGTAQGQVSFESTAPTPQMLIRRMDGRLGMTIQDGDIVGIALADGFGHAPADAIRRGGHTPFQQIQINANVVGGIAQLAEATLDSSVLHASMTGSASIIDKTLKMTARSGPALDSAADGPAYALDLSGPWSKPVLALESVSPALNPR